MTELGANPSVGMRKRAAALAPLALLAGGGFALSGAGALSGAAAVEARGAELRQEHEPVGGSLANVCHLKVKRVRFFLFPGTFNSTAVLFEGRHLITAAHNVHSTAFSRVTRIGAACGKANPSDADHAPVDLARVRVAEGYSWRKWERDFAVLETPRVIRSPRPMVLRPVAEGELVSGAIIAGFPGTDQRGAPETMDGEHMFSAEPMLRLEPGSSLIRYDLKTYTGNSGGPVWIETADGPLLIGIHVFGGGGVGTARRIDTEEAAVRAMIASLVS